LFQADPAAITLRQSDDLAWLFYTSDTTGQPKSISIIAKEEMKA
jgi:long-subunit acyl-CoA synthetase (AMP-forming)